MKLTVKGFDIHVGFLDIAAQRAVLAAVRGVVRCAPLSRYSIARGKQMSVRMTSAGRHGWVADPSGYRYAQTHPDGQAWPEIPAEIMAIWDAVTGLEQRPDSCLINYYDAEARMGMHCDDTEADAQWPVVSVSLGDEGLFRMGNLARGGKTQSHWLRSGDVVVMGGAARLAYHGVDRIRAGSSTLLPKGGRLNLTLRVAG